jgi:F-type H+-transporting ATPase subunit beta
MSKNIGKIAQIIGPVVDIKFENSQTTLPNIYDALEITRENGVKVTLECQSHIGEDTIRTISMDSTDGLSRGDEVVAMGTPILMPVGEKN